MKDNGNQHYILIMYSAFCKTQCSVQRGGGAKHMSCENVNPTNKSTKLSPDAYQSSHTELFTCTFTI